MEGHAVISPDVLASYAADAAVDVAGVRGLVEGSRRHHGVRVAEESGSFTLEVHISLGWGARAPEVGSAVQRRVAEYVARTAKLPKVAVDVVVSAIA